MILRGRIGAVNGVERDLGEHRGVIRGVGVRRRIVVGNKELCASDHIYHLDVIVDAFSLLGD